MHAGTLHGTACARRLWASYAPSSLMGFTRGSSSLITDRLTVQGQAEIGVNLWKSQQSACWGKSDAKMQSCWKWHPPHVSGLRVWGIMWNNHKIWYLGDIHALRYQESLRSERTQLSTDIFTKCVHFVSFYPQTQTRGYSKYLLNIYVLPGPPSSRLRYHSDAASEYDAQDNEKRERKRPRITGFISCSAPSSDWLIPAEVSRLAM